MPNSSAVKYAGQVVIPPFLTGCIRRTYAAIFGFWAGVMPPMPMFGPTTGDKVRLADTELIIEVERR